MGASQEEWHTEISSRVKTKTTNIEDSSQQTPPDSLEKGENVTTGEAMKRGQKENKEGGPRQRR